MLFAYYRVPVGCFRARRPDLSDIHRQPHAARHLGAVDRGDSGGGHVELERGAEFPVVEFDDGFLSSLSSGLVPKSSDAERLRLARLATVAMGARVVRACGAGAARVGRVVEVGLQIASVAYGALLGVFLLGVLTKRANQPGAIVGMICGLATELYLWGWSHVAFTWWVAIGTCVTFAIGYAASMAVAEFIRSLEPPSIAEHRKETTVRIIFSQ